MRSTISTSIGGKITNYSLHKKDKSWLDFEINTLRIYFFLKFFSSLLGTLPSKRISKISIFLQFLFPNLIKFRPFSEEKNLYFFPKWRTYLIILRNFTCSYVKRVIFQGPQIVTLCTFPLVWAIRFLFSTSNFSTVRWQQHLVDHFEAKKV